MFEQIGSLAVRRRWIVVAVWLLAVAATLPLLPSIEEPLKVGGFTSDDTEAADVGRLLNREFGLSPSSMVLIYQSERWAADDPAFLDSVEASLSAVDELTFVEDVLLPSVDRSLIAPSGAIAYAVVGLELPPEEAQRLVPEFEEAIRQQEDLDIIVAGAPAFYADIETASQRDLRRAEFIAFPFALIALLVVFSSVVAAAVPLIVGAAGVAIILLTIYGLAHVTDMTIFVLNLASMLGLGLAVDYCLFVTSRYREELDRTGGNVERSVVAAAATAGRAVFFSGMTVLAGLAGLMIFPLMFLRSVGVAGVVVVAVSTLAALTLLPAVLAIIGTRINRLTITRIAQTGQHHDETTGFWHGLAVRVMRRPVIVTLLTIGLMVMLGLPFLRANISSPDATILPDDLPSRQGFDLLAEEFSGGEISPFVLAVQSDGNMFAPENLQTVNALVRLLEQDERITRVQSGVAFPGAMAGNNPTAVVLARRALEFFGTDTRLDNFLDQDAALILAYPEAPANDPANKALLADLRQIDLGEDQTLLVGGGTAEIVDVVDAIYGSFPLAALIIVGSTYLILLVLFRSVLLPLKAIFMNVMSILASYGALVWIFQEGNLSGLLNFTPQGFVEASLPVIMFCVLFGLSMDYEVFLLSRIQEEWERTHDNTRAVAVGLQRSGRIITSAALIVVVVTASFVTGDVVLVKALGLGIALAVALDATVIRALLVPATMRLLGRANWWVPAPLRRVLPAHSPVEHG